MAAPGAPTDSRPADDPSVEESILALMDDDLDIAPGDDPEGDVLEDRDNLDDPPAEPKKGDDEPAKPEGDDEPEGDPEPKGDDEPAKGGDKPSEAIETLAELAGEFDVSEDQLVETLQVPLEDGTKVPLKDVITSYKGAPEAASIAREVEAERDTLSSRSKDLDTREEKDLRSLAALTDTLLREIEGTDEKELVQLKEAEPLEYLKRRDELDRRRQLVGQGLSRLREADTNAGKRADEDHQEFAKREIREVRRLFPSWFDRAGTLTEGGNQAQKQIDSFLLSSGFSQEEIDGQLVDHRTIEVVHKAAEYDRLRKKLPLLRKRTKDDKGKPKPTLRAGARRGAGERGADKSKAILRRLHKTGSEDDAAAAIADQIL